MQMLFTAMLIDALHAAFEDTEIAFDGVAVDRAVGEIDILARAVRRGAVTSEMQLHVAKAAKFIRHHASRSEEHTSELQSLMRISYAVFCLNKKMYEHTNKSTTIHTETPAATYRFHYTDTRLLQL